MLDDYDVVLIDCQPSLGLLTVNALTAADGVIIPLECEFFALRGVALLHDTIDKVQRAAQPRAGDRRHPRHDVRRAHPAQPRGRWQRLVEAFGDQVFHTVIRRTVKFPDTTVAGEPITTYASTHRAPRPTASWPGRCSPVARRVSLPAADDLFRPTAPSVERAATAGDAWPATGRRAGRPSRPSGRVRHDEKMTVYVTSDELLDLEHARLSLRPHARPGRGPRPAGPRGGRARAGRLEANGDDSVLGAAADRRNDRARPDGAGRAESRRRRPGSRCTSTTSRGRSTCCSA